MENRLLSGDTLLSGHRSTGLEKATSLGSQPRHADSPTSLSSQGSLSSNSSDVEVSNALNFMHKFLHGNIQEVSEKPSFLACVDRVTSSSSREKRGGSKEQHYSLSLLRETLLFLLPETSSPNAEERELAVSRVTKIICCIKSSCVTKEMKDFRLGQVAGCLTLCSSDPSVTVSHWAVDGLHRLYTLIMHQKSMTKTEDNQEFLELLQEWEEEKTFWLAWFSDASTTTTIFKRHLRADDQMDFLLMAVKGMRDDSVHSTKAAVHMMKAMLREPRPNLVKVPKATCGLYCSLEHISNGQARHEVFRFLRLLGSSRPEEVVKALLGCSLQCDSSAAAMWHVLMSFSDQSQKILNILRASLAERLCLAHGPGKAAILTPLAATAALYEILRSPSPACREVLRDMYPTLCIALLCQITYTVHFTPQEIDLYWRMCLHQRIPTPPVPLRSAMRTFKALVRRVSGGDQSLIMNQRRGSELLQHRGTHQKGLDLFARALVRNQSSEKMFAYVMEILDSPEDMTHITVMTFLVELLHQKAFRDTMEDLIIQQLCKQLKASRVELRLLSLKGMLCLATYPEQMMKLRPVLSDILSRLREANREINIKALKVLPHLLKSLEDEEVNSLTMEVATSVLPLFDDASNRVRLAAVSTFNSLYKIIKRSGKEQMKELALQSLVPLMVHLQDESAPVTQACWVALKRTDRFLKSFIQLPIKERDSQSFCTSLVKRYRDQGEAVLLEQAFAYLENPRKALRDGAIKLLETIAQETKHKETLTAIGTVLNLVNVNAKPSHIYLVASEVIGTVGQGPPSEGLLDRYFARIRTICRK